MHSKARLKKLKMVRCRRIDIELYKNFYAKLGVQIWTALVRYIPGPNLDTESRII